MGPRLAALVAVVLLTACAGEPAPQSAPSRTAHAVDGLTATVVQYTRDRPARVVQVKFTNTSGEALDVIMLQPRLQGFPAAERPEQTSHLEPDDRRDFPVALGPPSCGTPGARRSEVVIRATSADGVPVDHRVPIDDPHGLLGRVHTSDCAVARVESAVDITVDDWRRTGEGADATVVAHVTMALRPHGRSAEVADLDAGLLLGITSGRPEGGGADPTYTVDGTRPRTEWDIELVGARCDGHALGESQRLMVLTFWVSVDGAEPVPLRRAPEVGDYRTLMDALLERCEHREATGDE